STIDSAAAGLAVSTGTFGAMGKLFDGKAGAIAYMLFILMYFPCVAAMAAVYRETNRPWTLFVAAWTTGLAYVSATGFYQLATFAKHPTFSAAWLAGSALFCVLVVLIMRAAGKERPAVGRAVPVKS
ncbi:MAG: nucleoside recognition domain-containing protein, partial [Alphaproteobacteria bacterium]|nr:nucleoside recognition domain-containing protein [Alphaproteobacteria bacterium]